MGTAELHYLLGKYAAEWERKAGLKDVSVLAAAYRAGVPCYTSSPGDSTIGMNVAGVELRGNKLRLNPSIDVNETTAFVLAAKRAGGKSAVVLWGGGSPKNFMLQTEPQIQEVLRIKEYGQDYFLQVTDARPDTGGLSGATPSEAVSWGKVDPDRLPDAVVCYTDTTIAMPLLTHYALARHKPRKLEAPLRSARQDDQGADEGILPPQQSEDARRVRSGSPMTARQLLAIAKEHGTPVVVIDHDIIRRNYASFKKHLPKVQAYYAVKANPAPEIVRTLYRAGASFDVASLPEFMLVYENIQHLPAKQQQDFIWDKIVYANPIKPKETLQALDQYKPLVTFDNPSELRKIKQYAPHAGVVLRLRVPNTGSMVELSSKFGCDPGEAVDLILEAFRHRAGGRGPELPRRQPVHELREFRAGAEHVGRGHARSQGARPRNQDSGYRRRFPGALQPHVTLLQRAGKENQRRDRPALSARTLRSSPSQAGSSWPRRRPPSRGSSAKRSATARPATTSTTASITRIPASSSTTATIT